MIMCNCVEKLKERLKTELPSKNKSYANLKINEVEIGGECWLGNGSKLVSGLSLCATLYHEPIGRKKKSDIYLAFTFCPFCGEPYEDGENK